MLSDGVCDRNMGHAMNEGRVLKSVLSNRRLEINAKKCRYEGVATQITLYGVEAWGKRSDERMKVSVLEMKCLINK